MTWDWITQPVPPTPFTGLPTVPATEGPTQVPYTPSPFIAIPATITPTATEKPWNPGTPTPMGPDSESYTPTPVINESPFTKPPIDDVVEPVLENTQNQQVSVLYRGTFDRKCDGGESGFQRCLFYGFGLQ